MKIEQKYSKAESWKLINDKWLKIDYWKLYMIRNNIHSLLEYNSI